MGQSIPKLEFSEQQLQERLQSLLASSSSPRDLRRACVVLMHAEGKSLESAPKMVVNRPMVGLWERRVRARGQVRLKDAKGRGRTTSTSITLRTVQHVLPTLCIRSGLAGQCQARHRRQVVVDLLGDQQAHRQRIGLCTSHPRDKRARRQGEALRSGGRGFRNLFGLAKLSV